MGSRELRLCPIWISAVDFFACVPYVDIPISLRLLSSPYKAPRRHLMISRLPVPKSIVVNRYEFAALSAGGDLSVCSYTPTAPSMHLIKSLISNGFLSRHTAPAAAAFASRFESERAVINRMGVVEP
jgi:hypothetical protein